MSLTSPLTDLQARPAIDVTMSLDSCDKELGLPGFSCCMKQEYGSFFQFLLTKSSNLLIFFATQLLEIKLVPASLASRKVIDQSTLPLLSHRYDKPFTLDLIKK